MQNRVKWTNDMVEHKILEVVDFLKIDRMPTFSEIEEYFRDSRLSNRISKTGGIHTWSKRLNLPVKESESQLGYEIESEIKQILEDNGFSCELTGTRHPYDILVNGCVKIDVKAARMSKVRGSCIYSFGLSKSQHTCDIYIAVCLDNHKKIEKTFIIPAHIMRGKTQLAMGIKNTRYNKYLNRWDLIKDFENLFKSIS